MHFMEYNTSKQQVAKNAEKQQYQLETQGNNAAQSALLQFHPVHQQYKLPTNNKTCTIISQFLIQPSGCHTNLL